MIPTLTEREAMKTNTNTNITTGYCNCDCRDCFEIAIGSDTNTPNFCNDCESAGCELDTECAVTADDYPLPRFNTESPVFVKAGIAGTLRKYTELGTYPIYYIDCSNNCLCSDCANTADKARNEWPEDAPIAADVNYDNTNLSCDECSDLIGTAY